MALVDLFGENVQGKGGLVKTDTLADCEQIGIYFSAHWCPPCRGFTPALAETYKALNESKKRCEIVFVSSDRDANSFNEYYDSMPWLALPFDNRDKKEELSSKYEVTGIPTLVLVNPSNGELITTNGRNKVAADPKGEGFPWSGQ